MKVYFELKPVFLRAHPICARCPAPAVDVHHAAGRGKNLNCVHTWIALCRRCHDWVHQHPIEARAEGLLR